MQTILFGKGIKLRNINTKIKPLLLLQRWHHGPRKPGHLILAPGLSRLVTVEQRNPKVLKKCQLRWLNEGKPCPKVSWTSLRPETETERGRFGESQCVVCDTCEEDGSDDELCLVWRGKVCERSEGSDFGRKETCRRGRGHPRYGAGGSTGRHGSGTRLAAQLFTEHGHESCPPTWGGTHRHRRKWHASKSIRGAWNFGGPAVGGRLAGMRPRKESTGSRSRSVWGCSDSGAPCCCWGFWRNCRGGDPPQCAALSCVIEIR